MKTRCYFSSSHLKHAYRFCTATKVNNLTCLQYLENLYAVHKPKRSTAKQRDEIIQQASIVYQSIAPIECTKDIAVITKFVKLCMDYDRISHFKLVWDDLITLHQNNKYLSLDDGPDPIPYDLLFKCCIKTNDTTKAIQILHWISSTKSQLRITDSFITKLIVTCSNDRHRLNDIHLIHSLIRNQQIQCQQYQYIDTALISAFGKHHCLDDAKSVFDSVSSDKRDVFYIGSMMKALIDNNQYHQALDLYDSSSIKIEMDSLCHCMAIKACCSTLNLEKGQLIFDYLKNPNIHHKTAMMDLYANCHQMHRAMDLFRECHLNEINIITINTMINGYIHNAFYREALEMYDSISGRFGKKKNEISYNLALKACVLCGDRSGFERGTAIHREIISELFTDSEIPSKINSNSNHRQSNHTKLHRNRNRSRGGHFVKLKSALIDFYSHFGDITTTQSIYESIPKDQRDVICVSAMMTAYIRNEHAMEVLNLFDSLSMPQRDGTVYNLALKACGQLFLHQKAMDIHREIMDRDSSGLIMNRQIIHTLIDTFGRCGDMENARNLYHSIPIEERDVISTNVLMTALIHNKFYMEAMAVFDENVNLRDATTYTLGIKICSEIGDEAKGRLLHDEIRDFYPIFLRKIEVQNTLMDFYGTIGEIESAEKIFDEIPNAERTVVTFGTMMNVLVDNGESTKAMAVYDRLLMMMEKRNDIDISPNMVLHKLAIKACANLGDLERGMAIHKVPAVRKSNDITLKTTLIDFYGRCHQMERAQNAFDSINDADRDIVAVNALMNGYCSNKKEMECIEVFKKYANHLPVEPATFVTVLNAACNGDHIECGLEIHERLTMEERNWMILENVHVQIALINMFGKIAMIEQCESIFDDVKESENVRESGIWNGMIHCYCINGRIDDAMRLFEEMKQNDMVNPDRITFGILMSGHAHCGRIREIMQRIKMQNVDGDENANGTDLYLTSSVVDGLARNGMLNEAFEMIQTVSGDQADTSTAAMWMSLLAGCKKEGDKVMGDFVFRHIQKTWSNNAELITSARTLLSNIYAECGDFEVADQLRVQL